MVKNKKLLRQRGIGISESLGHANNVMLAAYAMGHDRSNSIHVEERVVDSDKRIEFDRLIVENFAREIQDLPKNVQSLVLSNEHCHSNLIDAQEIEKLRELLTRVSDNITVIVYLRRQIDVRVSHYSTLLKLGSSVELGEHIAQLSLSHYYNYLELINLWAGAFGKDKVMIRIFEKPKLVGGDLITDFCNAVDIADLADLKSPERMNESVTPQAQRLLLQFNRFRMAHPLKNLESMHNKFRSHLIKKYPGKGVMPFRALAIEKQSIFSAANADLNRIYLNATGSPFSESFDEFPN